MLLFLGNQCVCPKACPAATSQWAHTLTYARGTEDMMWYTDNTPLASTSILHMYVVHWQTVQTEMKLQAGSVVACMHFTKGPDWNTQHSDMARKRERSIQTSLILASTCSMSRDYIYTRSAVPLVNHGMASHQTKQINQLQVGDDYIYRTAIQVLIEAHRDSQSDTEV